MSDTINRDLPRRFSCFTGIGPWSKKFSATLESIGGIIFYFMTKHSRKKGPSAQTKRPAQSSNGKTSSTAVNGHAENSRMGPLAEAGSCIAGPYELSESLCPSNTAACRLEMILAELERGCFNEKLGPESDALPQCPKLPANEPLSNADSVATAASRVHDPIGYIRKKMAALGFQTGVHLCSSGAITGPTKGEMPKMPFKHFMDSLPGEVDYELTFDEEADFSEENADGYDSVDDEQVDLGTEVAPEIVYAADGSVEVSGGMVSADALDLKRMKTEFKRVMRAIEREIDIKAERGSLLRNEDPRRMRFTAKQAELARRLDDASGTVNFEDFEEELIYGSDLTNSASDDADEYDVDDDLLLLEESKLASLDPLRILSHQLKQQHRGPKSAKAAPEEATASPPRTAQEAPLAGGALAQKPTAQAPLQLIDPLKLQVIQSAESELLTVHDLFEDATIPATQKLPLLKRKYMELMQQDIRHRLDSLRMRDYLDTLHLERQVVERELERANNLKSTLEHLCDQLQSENARIKAEKTGMSVSLYEEFELQSILTDEVVEEKQSKPGKHGRKGNGKKKDNSGASLSTSVTACSVKNGFPTTLPQPLKPLSFEIPDNHRLLDGCGDAKVLTGRISALIELYNRREDQFMKALKAKDSEIALLQTHFYAHTSQIQKQNTANRDMSLKLMMLTASEADLRAQLVVYVDKFRQVEETLAKSNDLFATFRQEMEQMGSKLQRLERENSSLQVKCNTLSRNIVEMAEERSKQVQSIEVLKSQKGKLETLCRSMQVEKNTALAQLAAATNSDDVASNRCASTASLSVQ